MKSFICKQSFCGLLLLSFPLSLAIPIGFVAEQLLSRIDAISGNFVPNPRKNGQPMLLLSSKGGRIFAVEDIENGTSIVQVADFSSIICDNGERGLESTLPHPDFESDGSILMYYTSKVGNCSESPIYGPNNHLSVVKMDPLTLQISLSSEQLLLETPPASMSLHNGGAMKFGNDGLLYLTVGDGGSRADAQDLRSLYGKIIRLDKFGNVPADNPYAAASGGTGVPCRLTGGRPGPSAPPEAVCEEIFAHGLRNPFRISMDEATTDKVRFVVGDVGGSTWEEISEAGTDYKGANYGWPKSEGPCNFGSVSQCLPQGPGVTEPFHFYQHESRLFGGAVTGSTFVPPNALWPEKYKFLFIDFCFGVVYSLVKDDAFACRNCTPPRSGFRNETFHRLERSTDLIWGPYKNGTALYILQKVPGSIWRVRYTGNKNQAPKAAITGPSSTLLVNQSFTFIGSGSKDPENKNISFYWDFGDGTTSTAVNPVKSYARRGQFIVTLKVKDDLDQTGDSSVTVQVGSLPTGTILSPSSQLKFSVGQRLTLQGRARTWNGTAIPDAQISWEVRLRHGSHFHPFLEQTMGNNIVLSPAPRPEDFIAASNSFLQVFMYAVDFDGVVMTKRRDVYPVKLNITVDSVPQGLEIFVDDYPITTPRTIISWQNHNLKLFTNVDQGSSVFSSWSFGSVNAQSDYLVPPPNASASPVVTAYFIPKVV